MNEVYAGSIQSANRPLDLSKIGPAYACTQAARKCTRPFPRLHSAKLLPAARATRACSYDALRNDIAASARLDRAGRSLDFHPVYSYLC